ncbi:MAG: sugar ABC transporter permease [Chloroflexi bacterium]|nr:sugar ABC transporter permease [Chloroflexota bacterium]
MDQRFWRALGRWGQPYLFILPGFLIYLVFVLIPIISTVRYSFFDWTGFSEATFIGFDNYIELANDRDFWRAIGNNAFFVVFYTIIPIIFALFLTSLMTRGKLRGMAFFRTGLFIPQVMSMVVVGIIWRWLFTIDGPINQLLTLVGLESWVRPWLGDFTFARYAVGAVGSWVQYGLAMVLFLAGIQAIDEELYDAAKVFGANALQQFRYVTLPGLRQQIIVAFVLTFIAALRVFDLVFVLTRGGPGKETWVTSYMVYEETFRFNRAGYGAAIAVTMALVIVTVSAVVFWVQSRDDRNA